MSENLNGYNLSRAWFDFCFENPEKIKPIHTAIFCYAIEHCNRLGWKSKFGFPSSMVMECIGVKSYKTYINAFNDIIDFGFFNLIEKSRNQYSSNIIALALNDKAHTKALDKALSKHIPKHCQSTIQSIGESTDSINKPLTNKPITNKPINHKQKENKFSKKHFKKILLDLGAEEIYIDDWFKARDKKRAVYTETSLKNFVNECSKNNFVISKAVKTCAEEGWSGFKVSWYENLNENNYAQKNKQISKKTVKYSDDFKRKVFEKLQPK